MSTVNDNHHLSVLGARIFSEANDLKRTPEALAAEIAFDLEAIEAVIEGRADADTAKAVVHAMVDTYPISLADLWVEPDDTDGGVSIMRAADSAATARVFERTDRSGGLAPYYEYRDTAMSRTAPFKPEWIKELRVVEDADPDNPDVAYNNGHLMHQCTFFIGAVNFYWRIGGHNYCAEMDTGDSNYVTPFVPHSFTTRNPDEAGLILAVTYGGPVRQAIDHFGRMGHQAADALAGDRADAFGARLGRLLAAESMTREDLVRRLEDAGMDRHRADDIISGGGQPTPPELAAIAVQLNVRVEEVTVSQMTDADLVTVCYAREQESRSFPNDNKPAYRMTELARSPHQPGLKGFEITVLFGADLDEARIRHGLHEYVYNYGTEPVEIHWDGGRSDVLGSGDSAYVRPMVGHAFRVGAAGAEGHLATIRVPGELTDAVVEEFASFAPEERGRVLGETKRWF